MAEIAPEFVEQHAGALGAAAVDDYQQDAGAFPVDAHCRAGMPGVVFERCLRFPPEKNGAAGKGVTPFGPVAGRVLQCPGDFHRVARPGLAKYRMILFHGGQDKLSGLQGPRGLVFANLADSPFQDARLAGRSGGVPFGFFGDNLENGCFFPESGAWGALPRSNKKPDLVGSQRRWINAVERCPLIADQHGGLQGDALGQSNPMVVEEKGGACAGFRAAEETALFHEQPGRGLRGADVEKCGVDGRQGVVFGAQGGNPGAREVGGSGNEPGTNQRFEGKSLQINIQDLGLLRERIKFAFGCDPLQTGCQRFALDDLFGKEPFRGSPGAFSCKKGGNKNEEEKQQVTHGPCVEERGGEVNVLTVGAASDDSV